MLHVLDLALAMEEGEEKFKRACTFAKRLNHYLIASFPAKNNEGAFVHLMFQTNSILFACQDKRDIIPISGDDLQTFFVLYVRNDEDKFIEKFIEIAQPELWEHGIDIEPEVVFHED